MKKSMRRAIAMIELIFAIVILGIVLMSAPMLIATASKSGYVALQQEAIASASSEIGMILTHQWDERNTDNTRNVSILLTDGDADLNQEMNGTIPTGRRAGTPTSSARRFFDSLGVATPATAPGDLGSAADGGDIDDIDDFITAATGALYDEESTSTLTGDVVDKDITIEVRVRYLDDSPEAGSSSYAGTSNTLRYDLPFTVANGTPQNSNIKEVEVELTTTRTEDEFQKTIILDAFSCNIGSYQLNQVVFP